MGGFVNLVAFKADLTGEPCLIDVVRRARDTLNGVTLHQEMPFELLSAALQDAGRVVPNVQAIFQYVKTLERPLALAGLDVTRAVTPVDGGGLLVSVVEGFRTTRVIASCNQREYDPAGAEDLVRQIFDIAQAIVTIPDAQALHARVTTQ